MFPVICKGGPCETFTFTFGTFDVYHEKTLKLFTICSKLRLSIRHLFLNHSQDESPILLSLTAEVELHNIDTIYKQDFI